MITWNRSVLIIQSEDHLEDIKYEAIQVIDDVSLVEDVWRNNKTPAMLKSNAEEARKRYPCIMVPAYLFGHEHFINFCHENGIECGEYKSGTKHNTADDRCFLCAVGKHLAPDGIPFFTTTLFNMHTPEVNDIVIYESEHFYVKIEYGCMIKGMVMICPKDHILSAARIPSYQMSEYIQVMKDIEFLLKGVYGNETVIFFEHGSDPSGFSSHKRSIVHAHTHVAWGVKFPQKYKDMVCLKEVSSLKDLSETKYFSYQEGSTGKLYAVSDPEVYVQRQYPRQVIGELLGIPNEKTNWRKEAFMDNIIATFDDIHAYLVENQHFLNTRILNATECFVEGYPLRNNA